jgi:hypothetical protein
MDEGFSACVFNRFLTIGTEKEEGSCIIEARGASGCSCIFIRHDMRR